MEQAIETKKGVEALLQKRPLIISGPCSAETEEQVLQTATRLAATGKIDMLRAGIWVNILGWGVIIAVSAATAVWRSWLSPGGGSTSRSAIAIPSSERPVTVTAPNASRSITVSPSAYRPASRTADLTWALATGAMQAKGDSTDEATDPTLGTNQ